MGLSDLLFPVGNVKTEPPVSTTTPNVAGSPSVSDEATHITQEMYKKNFELAEKNKTLSVLQKLDEIVLSSVMNTSYIAKEVTKVLVEGAEFKAAGIFLVNNANELHTLAIYISPGTYNVHSSTVKKIYGLDNLPLTVKENVLVQAVMQRETKQTKDLASLLIGIKQNDISVEEVKQIQKDAHIKTSFAYPLIVRNQCLGLLVICISESEADLSDYQKDLLRRLHTIIGIAIDNSLLYRQVQDSNVKLKALDKLKDEFVSLASHELRTPMTAIKSYIWMALDGRGGELNDKLKYYLTRAYMSTNRLINLVNDLLNISRVESGRITVQMASIDLYKLAQEVIEEVGPRASEVGVSVILDPIEQPLPPVFADADKIKEVFINLIGNSLKFTPNGGNVHIHLSQHADMVETKIIDTGNGIEPADLPKLFQKFAMIEGSYTANQPVQGTGLGLYICKALISLHNGTISAASEGHGKGATFTFTLRIFKEEDEQKYNMVENSEKVGLVHSQI